MKKIDKDQLRTPKGMHDILPDVLPYYERVIREIRRVGEYYGFQAIRTPHVERLELFTASLGDTSDVVEKQMYAFRSRGGSPLVLRPEGTASIMRAYFEHGMQSWTQPVKLFYSGSFFRHENPQAGRTREFTQVGLEVLGDTDAIHDALVIKILAAGLEMLHLPDVVAHVNSIGDKQCRPAYRKELSAYYRRKQQRLCKDCKRRLKDNPLRLLDCKNPECVELKKDAPVMMDYLCEYCKAHFRAVLEYLDETGVRYELDPYLVRGLDYYTKTVFELFLPIISSPVAPAATVPVDAVEVAPSAEGSVVITEESVAPPKIVVPRGASSLAIAGGGRYDDLGSTLFGRAVPAVGGSLGVDRIALVMRERGLKVRPEVSTRVFLIQIGPQAKRKSLLIAEELRKGGIPFAHLFSKDSLRGQLKIASKSGAPFVIIVGQKEAIEERAILRAMETGEQETVPFTKLVSTIKIRLKEL